MTLNPDDIPADLPAHPEEARLRDGERQLATTLDRLAKKTVSALRQHRRVDSAVLLAQLAATAYNGQKAITRAIQDQMDAANPRPDTNPDAS